MDMLIHFGVPAVAVALVAAALAWLLQRRRPGWHPVVTALVANLLIAVAAIMGLGITVFRTLAAIGAAGHADISNDVAPTASLVIWGGLVLTLVPIAGLPAALLTAFNMRKRRDPE